MVGEKDKGDSRVSSDSISITGDRGESGGRKEKKRNRS
jgi:hypothetical protein